MVIQTPEERARDLLARMTIEEKAQQVTCVPPFRLLSADGPREDQLAAELSGGIGHVAMFAMFQHQSPADHARAVNRVQRYLVENTRLGIPAIFHIEALNGLVAPEFTVFPTAISLAATWNTAGVQAMAQILARQSRALGYGQALSPVMDVARDARWGRVHETYGEDPYLVSEFSVAYTRGLQGADRRSSPIATGKHFLGFAVTVGGQHMSATVPSGRELREVYARPFEAAIRLAGLESVMNSYSTIDGVPVAASREILTDMLRGELGFEGTVVADYGAIGGLVNRQETARDWTDAGVQALEAGLDVELAETEGYGQRLATAVRQGLVAESLLDRSVLRVLRDKFALGLFDAPYVREDPTSMDTVAHEGSELARELAEQSVVLLRNDGTLPLDRRVPRVAVIGPHAENAGVGFPAYTFFAALGLLGAVDTGDGVNMAGLENSSLPDDARAALTAQLAPHLERGLNTYAREHYGSLSLTEAVRLAASGAAVVSAVGCGILDHEPTAIDEAVAAAADADVIIVAIGGRAGWFGAHQTEGEGSDQADIDLPAVQTELVRRLAALGRPMVGVVFTGRPIALTSIDGLFSSLVYAGYGGQCAATAVAGVLFGDVNPSGKLPISLPRHSGQVPLHYGQHLSSGFRRTESDPHKGYNDMSSRPLYAFGHGIGYAPFAYSELALVESTIPTTGEIRASVVVTNTGDRSGTEIVQFYTSHRARAVTRPERELVGFARVELEPGQSRTVEIAVSTGQIAYLGRGHTFVFEEGEITFMAGASSDDIRLRTTVLATGATADWNSQRPLVPVVRVAEAARTA